MQKGFIWTNGTGTIEHPYVRKKEKRKKNLNSYLTPYTNINWKWIVNLNMKSVTMNISRRNQRRKSLWPEVTKGSIKLSMRDKWVEKNNKRITLGEIQIACPLSFTGTQPFLFI